MRNAFVFFFVTLLFINCNSQETENYFELGINEMSKKNFDKAIILFSNAIDNDEEKAESYFARGLSYNLIKNFEKSTRDFTSAENLGYNDIKLYTLRGFAYNQINRNDLAIKDIDKAISMDSDYYPPNYFNRAMLNVKLNRNEEAVNDLNIFIEKVGDDSNAYFERGKILLNQNKKENACLDFKKAISFGSTNSELLKLQELYCK